MEDDDLFVKVGIFGGKVQMISPIGNTTAINGQLVVPTRKGRTHAQIKYFSA